MDIKKLNDIYYELISDKKKFGVYCKSDVVEEFLRNKKLSHEDYIYLLDQLSRYDVFRWLDFITKKLVVVAINNIQFRNLIAQLISMLKNDMAQGPFIDALIKIGEENSEALNLYNDLVKRPNDESIYHYSALLLGGAGRKNPKLVENSIQQFRNVHNVKFRASVLAFAQVVLETDSDLVHKTTYKKLINEALETKNIEIMKQATVFILEYYKRTYEKAFIEELIKQDYEEIFRIIIERVHLRGLNSPDYEFELVRRISLKKFTKLANPILRFVARRCKENKSESFKIFTNVLKFEENCYSDLIYAIENMGKSDYSFFRQRFVEYIPKVTNINRLQYLKFLLDYFTKQNNNYTEEFQYFEKLIDKQFNKLKLIEE